MKDDKIIHEFLVATRGNIHLEEGQRILELSINGLLDYFNVKDVKLTK